MWVKYLALQALTTTLMAQKVRPIAGLALQASSAQTLRQLLRRRFRLARKDTIATLTQSLLPSVLKASTAQKELLCQFLASAVTTVAPLVSTHQHALVPAMLATIAASNLVPQFIIQDMVRASTTITLITTVLTAAGRAQLMPHLRRRCAVLALTARLAPYSQLSAQLELTTQTHQDTLLPTVWIATLVTTVTREVSLVPVLTVKVDTTAQLVQTSLRPKNVQQALTVLQAPQLSPSVFLARTKRTKSNSLAMIAASGTTALTRE